MVDNRRKQALEVEANLTHEVGSWNFSGTTNGDGEVTFSLNQAPNGGYELKVTNVNHDNLSWDKEQPEENTFTK